MNHWAQRWRGLVGAMGRRDAALYLSARMLRTLSGERVTLHKYYFVVQPIAAQPLLPPHRGRSIEVRRIEAGDPLTAYFPRPPAVIARRFAAGALCFVAVKDGAFIGFLWLQSGSYLEDEVQCRFTPLPAQQAVWDFDVYVDEAHRRGFTFARLWDGANAHCRERGIRWTLSRISAFNAGSLVSHAVLGATPLGRACFLQAGRAQLMWSDMVPRLHVLRPGGEVPELRLRAESSAARHYERFSKAH